MNFVAPELLGMCTMCGLFDCDGCRGDQASKQKRSKTMETDVYAFGCLYYAVRIDFYLVSALLQDLDRHSLIPLPFMTRPTFKSSDLSWTESARID